MATYDDFEGVYFTIQSLRLHHPITRTENVEFLVIDNNPVSSHGKMVKQFLKEKVPNSKYIPYLENQSTISRWQIIKHSSFDYILILDCHVLLEPGAIDELISYYEKNPKTKNLIQGPMYDESFEWRSSHQKEVWENQFYGIFDISKEQLEKEKPFEIPMMGLGMFSFRKDSFPEVNEDFKEFGGEEWYLHEKFRRNGGKTICHPKLSWIHRFYRVDGVPYKHTFEARLWNYVIGWGELYEWDHPMIKAMYEYFIKIEPEETERIFLLAKEYHKNKTK